MKDYLVDYRDFLGVKAALLYENKILLIQRDNNPAIRHPGKWDMVGGGREGDESPFQCLIRETREEIGIDISSHPVQWINEYVSVTDPKLAGYFVVLTLTQEDIERVVLGDEGQGWQLFDIEEYLIMDNVIETQRERLKDYLNISK